MGFLTEQGADETAMGETGKSPGERVGLIVTVLAIKCKLLLE
jgi:hypothetical protein